ncbi:MAG: PASTA domain-containing protein [Actinobacteria bacterium]|nr:MAG: PASTA domain-containing protein [Actinomycetota bacterium]
MSLVRQGIDVAILIPMEQLITERPRRRPLIPRWLIITAVAIIVVIVGAVAGVVFTMRNGLIAIPAVVGRTTMEAKAVLDSAGLVAVEGGEWFSVTVPMGSIISQEPSAGALARRGDTVSIIVSAGSETFIMPDVVGTASADARLRLETLGLRVTLETVEASATEGTVTETYPTAGQEVRNGSTVRVRVAGRSVASSILLPYSMDGVTVVVDPAPVAAGSDTTMEVTRRLRSLLEASGAMVKVTRSIGSSSTATADRAAIVSETTATVVVALDLASSGAEGIQVTYVTSKDASATATTARLVASMTEALTSPGQVVRAPANATSAILSASTAPGARIILGNARGKGDASLFADPAWADTVARALYRALGATFGRV